MRLPLHRGAEPICEGAQLAGLFAASRGKRPLDKCAAWLKARPMNDAINLPDDCTTMDEVRAGVDATDQELIALLDRRFGYMRAAARIKPTRDSVRDEERKAAVIGAAADAAAARGMPRERVEAIWDLLVENSIAYEFEIWDQTRSQD
ncbi:Isochorismate lyase [Altererythrobacter insulae]|nr:Isochorismate lyase [Altererythrobacter insulae]